MSKPCVEYLDRSIYPVQIAFTSIREKFDKEMKRLDVDEAELKVPSGADGWTAQVEYDDVLTIVVCIDARFEIDDITTVGIIAHESLHVVDSIMRHIHEDHAGWEMRAYTLQWLVESFIKIYDREHKERKKKAKKK
jgi:hypothetical protein